MKDVSLFLRRFLLFVFYANISTTSPFHLEGVKEPRTTSPVAKERWHGPSRTQQLYSEPIPDRKRSVFLQGGVLLAMTSSSSSSRRLLTSRRLDVRVDEDYQRDPGKVGEEDEEEEEEEEEVEEDEDEERRSQTDRRHHQCLRRLDIDIESCLDGYERMQLNINPKEQLNDSFKLELCQKYEKTMQCLHVSFSLCRPRHLHLQLIAYRLGYLRIFMEQTCDQLDNDYGDPSMSPSSPPPVLTPTTSDPTSSEVTVDRTQVEPHEIGDATIRVLSNLNATGLGSAFTASIVVPSDFSKSRIVLEPPNSTSLSSLSRFFLSSSTTSSATSSSATPSTSSHLRMTAEHVTGRADAGCGDALSCRGRNSDADKRQQQRTSHRMRASSSQHATSASTIILASIFPVVNSSTPSLSFNRGLTLDQQATTAATQWPFLSGSSTGETTETGALVTASSSVGGTKAVQCYPGVTCSRTNSAGNANRNDSLDYNCLALSAIVFLVRLVSICLCL